MAADLEDELEDASRTSGRAARARDCLLSMVGGGCRLSVSAGREGTFVT